MMGDSLWVRGALALAVVVLAIAWPGRPALAIPPPPPLKAWTDPFYEGLALKLSMLDQENDTRTLRTLTLDATYAWESGIALTLEVPSVVADSTAGDQHFSVPVLGGNGTGRIQAEGEYRLWGDLYDYFAVGIGVGLPIASDDNTRSTISTMLLGELFGQLDWGWIQFRYDFLDGVTTPSVNNVVSTGVTTYTEISNYIQYSLTLLFYPFGPSGRLAPFVTWNEQLPRSTGAGAAVPALQGADIVLIGQPINRVRFIGFGFELAPLTDDAAVFTLQGQEYDGLGADVAGAAQWAVQGSVRWNF